MITVPASRIYRLLYPAVPAVVAAAYRGKVSAMPVVSIISLSNDPPMVGISSSPSHATHKTILKAGCFSVSWLDRRYGKTVEILGSESGARVRDKLCKSGLRFVLKSSPEVPIMREASAYLTCKLAEVRRYGDHNLLVARVETARAIRDFREYWEFKEYHPILYSGLGRTSLM